MAFRLGAIIPDLTDGTSFYRGIGPLTHLQNSLKSDVSLLINPPRMDWAWLMQIDALFLQRPSNRTNVAQVKMAKASGKPVWIDYDDDLYSVPIQNPTHQTYRNKETENCIGTLIVQADVITVSTEHLKRRIQDILVSIRGKAEDTPGVEPGG